VLDIGAHTVKGGYAGEDTPKAVYPTCLGSVLDGESADEPKKGERSGSGDVDMADAPVPGAEEGGAKRTRTLYVDQMGYRRDYMEVVNPYGKEGLFEDWELVEKIWDHTLKKCLLVDPTEHPMLIAEPAHATAKHREKMVELMFEKNGVPALFLAKNPVLTSFASGKATSLVVDLGGQGTTVSAVHDGYALTKGFIRTPLGGDMLADCMLRHIEQQGTTIRPQYSIKRSQTGPDTWQVKDLDFPHTTASYRAYCRREIVADLNAAVCRASEQKFLEADNANIPTMPYELPDGNTFEVGLERFKIPELLFQPELMSTFPNTQNLMGDDKTPMKGLHGLVLDAIGRCDVDVRKELYSGVLVTGGVSLIPNLRERLERELSDQVSSYTARVKVASPNPLVERKFSVFIGGSILASLGSFQQMWMSKMEYEENGAVLINRKCP